MKLSTFALAAAGLALTHPASAGITCNLTDQRGNALQYSFARGAHGYTNETVVKRNGAILSNGGPMWTRSFNSAGRTMMLQQGDWSLVYEAKPNDTDISRAALFVNTTQKAAGTCVADYSVDTPYSPPEVTSAPAAPPVEAAATPSTSAAPGSLSAYLGM